MVQPTLRNLKSRFLDSLEMTGAGVGVKNATCCVAKTSQKFEVPRGCNPVPGI
jgi:hypothetical protein